MVIDLLQIFAGSAIAKYYYYGSFPAASTTDFMVYTCDIKLRRKHLLVYLELRNSSDVRGLQL